MAQAVDNLMEAKSEPTDMNPLMNIDPSYFLDSVHFCIMDWLGTKYNVDAEEDNEIKEFILQFDHLNMEVLITSVYFFHLYNDAIEYDFNMYSIYKGVTNRWLASVVTASRVHDCFFDIFNEDNEYIHRLEERYRYFYIFITKFLDEDKENPSKEEIDMEVYKFIGKPLPTDEEKQCKIAKHVISYYSRNAPIPMPVAEVLA